MTVAELPVNRVSLQFPRAFERVLRSTKRYIVLIGGRGSAKSQSVAQWLLSLINEEGSDLLCGREFQGSIEDSVHKLMLKMVNRLAIEGVRDSDKKIDFYNGGKVRYKGFARNSSAVRSIEDFLRAWIEEAQSLSQASLNDLTPSVRGEDSQIIMTANLMASTDPFSQRFYVPFAEELQANGFYEDDMHLIVIMNWRDNPWWEESGLEKERQWDYDNRSRAEYDHIWEGKFNDSVPGSIIQAEWFDAAIDAHLKLGFKPQGLKIVSHDPSDLGADAKGLVYRHGSVFLDVQEKTGIDVNDGCDWATDYAIQNNADVFTWDCDGLGVSLRRQVAQALEGKNIEAVMFKGSESPEFPNQIYQQDAHLERMQSKKNAEIFRNKRAQYYIRLRDRFYATYRAVVKKEYINPDELISVSSDIKCMEQFRSEVCRIPKKSNGNGKIQIMSKDEMRNSLKIKSPNLADSAMQSMKMSNISKPVKALPLGPKKRGVRWMNR